MRSVSLALLLFFIAIGPVCAQTDSLWRAYSQQPNHPELLLPLMEVYKNENLDSVNHLAQRLMAHPQVEESLIWRARLIQIESHSAFNRMAEADSLLHLLPKEKVEADGELYIHYLIAQGKVLESKREFDLALEVLYKAVEEIQAQGKRPLLADVYSEVAFILSQNNDLENCKKYYGFAFEEAVQKGDIPLQVKICYQLCRVYNGGIMVNLDSSVHYGERGLAIAKKAGYERGYADMLNIVAAPIIRNGQYRKGLEMSKEALLYADKYNFDPKTRYYLILNQGFAYEKLGLYDSALVLMQQGANLRPQGLDHHRLAYLIYKSQRRNGTALEAFEVYSLKRDSVIKSRNEQNLSSLQARYESNLKEKEVNELTQKAELQGLALSQQRYLLLGLSSVLLLFVGGGVLLYRQRQLKQQQLMTDLELEETKKRLTLERQYRAAELKAIRSQMNPHFLFNALNSIQEYIMLNEKKLAGKYLGKFADLMRIYLNHSQAKTVSIREEVEALHLYLELEKLRFEDSFTFQIEVEESVDADLMNIPTLLVQPYAENALKHGLLHVKGEKKLNIHFHYEAEEDVMVCVIEDNGIGRKQSAQLNTLRNPLHKSFATEATKHRFELLNETQNSPIGEEIIDLQHPDGSAAGTRVILRIPLIDFAD